MCFLYTQNKIILLIKIFLSDDDLEKLIVEIVRANDRGISPLRNFSNEMTWSFGQALFFSSTVVTTIGN